MWHLEWLAAVFMVMISAVIIFIIISTISSSSTSGFRFTGIRSTIRIPFIIRIPTTVTTGRPGIRDTVDTNVTEAVAQLL